MAHAHTKRTASARDEHELAANFEDRAKKASRTLALIKAAMPVDETDMFPDFHDKEQLMEQMVRSLSEWDDKPFVSSAIAAFRSGEEDGCRRGMQLAMEKVQYYLPSQCDWGYLDDDYHALPTESTPFRRDEGGGSVPLEDVARALAADSDDEGYDEGFWE